PVEDLLGDKNSHFAARSERVVDPGYMAILSNDKVDESNLPKLSNGVAALVEAVNIKEGKTKQPPRYSETSFELAMVNAAREVDDPELRKYLSEGELKPKGIGTPASRKDI